MFPIHPVRIAHGVWIAVLASVMLPVLLLAGCSREAAVPAAATAPPGVPVATDWPLPAKCLRRAMRKRWQHEVPEPLPAPRDVCGYFPAPTGCGRTSRTGSLLARAASPRASPVERFTAQPLIMAACRTPSPALPCAMLP